MFFRFLQKKYKPRTFFLVVITLLMALHATAFVIYRFDLPYYSNYILLDEQIEKLNATDGLIQTIVVGDSSAGNGFDATFFSELSGGNTLNLSLTGSYGLVGSLNMVKQARLRHPEIQNVILIQTLDIWTRPFSREGFYRTEKRINTENIDASFFETNKLLDRLSYETDIRWIYRFVRYVLGRKPEPVFVNDYYHEAGELKTYRNGALEVPESGLPDAPIDPRKEKMYLLFNQYCVNEQLNCIFLNGPIHEAIAQKTDEQYFERVSHLINNAKGIHTFDTIFAIENENMGDSSDHVDISYKKNMTKRYYDQIRDYLK